MESTLLFNETLQPAKTQAQQLKVIMNLPVRIISDDKVMDVVPIPTMDIAPSKRRIIKFVRNNRNRSYPTPDQLIDFFSACQHGDLLTPAQVAYYYDVTIRTIRSWASKNLLKNYRLSASLILYKRDELPSVEEMYGPYEN